MGQQEKWTPEQAQQYFSQQRHSKAKGARLKYNNQPIEVDGIKFDSKKEADYYGRLKIRVRIGQLEKFEYHKVYKLIVNGVWITDYEADFVLYHPNGMITVVDVKSKATEKLPAFRIKKALMKALFGIDILIV